MSADHTLCIVNGVEYRTAQLKAAAPTQRDARVIVLGGKLRGSVGSVMSIIQDEAVVTVGRGAGWSRAGEMKDEARRVQVQCAPAILKHRVVPLLIDRQRQQSTVPQGVGQVRRLMLEPCCTNRPLPPNLIPPPHCM